MNTLKESKDYIKNQVVCLQVHNDYLTPGGETKSVHLIANLLEKKGIRVIRYYKSNDCFNQKDFLLKLKNGINSIYSLTTIKEIEKILQENQVDFALIHNTSPIISNSIYAVLHKHNVRIFKYIQNYNLLCLNGAMDKGETCYGCQHNSLKGVFNKCYKDSVVYSFQKYLSKFLLWNKYIKEIDKFIAISDYVKQIHIKAGLEESKIHVLYHFCEGEAKILWDNSKEKYFVYMGRLSSEKGVFTLIQAMERLPQIPLVILGKGELEDEINKYIENHQIENIKLLGYKTGKERDEIVGNAVALLVPSEWEEPFGRIVIEAYQVGTPVIASAVGGLNELIEFGITGFTFEEKNVDQLVDAVEHMWMLSDSQIMEMRKNCVDRVSQEFSPDSYFEKFKNTIECLFTL